MAERPPNRADERVAELVQIERELGLSAAQRRFNEIIGEDQLKLFEQVVIAGRFREARKQGVN